MIDYSGFLGGGGVAPEITQATPSFLSDFNTAGTKYYWDVLNKRALPEGLAISNAAAVTSLQGVAYGDHFNFANGGVTTDGKVWHASFIDYDSGGGTSWSFLVHAREMDSDVLQYQAILSFNASSSMSVSSSNCTSVTKAGDNVWFVLVSSSIISDTTRSDLMRVSYDTGTGTFSVLKAGQVGAGASTGVTPSGESIVYDAVNNLIIVVLPQGTTTVARWYSYDATTGVAVGNSTFPDAEVPNPLANVSSRGASQLQLLSDGNYMLIGSDTAAGGVYSWNGTAFTQVYDYTNTSTNMGVTVAPDMNFVVSSATETQGGVSVTYKVTVYSGGTLATTSYSIRLNGVSQTFTGGPSYASLGDNWVLVAGNEGLAAFQLDPSDNYQIKPETYIHFAADYSNKNIFINEDGVGFSWASCIRQLVASVTCSAGAAYSTGNLINNKRAIPLGSLVSSAAGVDTISIDQPHVQSESALVSGDIYGGYCAVDTQYAVPIDYCTPFSDRYDLATYSDAVVQQQYMVLQTSSVGGAVLKGTVQNSATQVLNAHANPNGSVGLFAYPYTNAAYDYSHSVFVDGICGQFTGSLALTSTSTSRSYIFAQDCKKVGVAFGAENDNIGLSIQIKKG